MYLLLAIFLFNDNDLYPTFYVPYINFKYGASE